MAMGSGGPTGGRASGRPCHGSVGSAWRRFPPVPAHGGLVWGCQKNFVCPESWFLCWDALFLACLRCSRCCSAQVSHLIWPWMVRAQQSTHSPRALASFRLAWVWWRCSSLRSGVLFLFRSYSCRFSFLASTSAGVGSGRRFGVGFLQGLLMVGFRFSFRDFFSLAWGPPPALLGSGNGMVSVKVRPTAQSCGVCLIPFPKLRSPSGSPPPMRGLPGRYLPAESERRITPAYAGSVHCALPTRTGPADHPRSRGVCLLCSG